MTEHAVVIAGGGPTGLMLAGELALAGVDVAIVERRAGQDLPGSRAGGLHSRTIEVLDQRGIADRFLSQGQVAQVAGFAWIRLDISDFPTRHPYGLALRQDRIERILAGWVDERRVPVYRGREVTGFAQDDTGVDVALSDGPSLRAQFLVGCDGGRSLVRKVAGIEFPGWDPTTSNLIANVEVDQEPKWGTRRDAIGVHAFSRLEDGTVGVMVTEAHAGNTTEPTLRDLSEALIAVYGTDYGLHRATWISRFTDMTRQAASYRDRRVLLAGDAAHVHYPVGGQGLHDDDQDDDAGDDLVGRDGGRDQRHEEGERRVHVHGAQSTVRCPRAPAPRGSAARRRSLRPPSTTVRGEILGAAQRRIRPPGHEPGMKVGDSAHRRE
jgi:3-(3-hydroxy-phenyl)propionate hydroxylase